MWWVSGDLVRRWRRVVSVRLLFAILAASCPAFAADDPPTSQPAATAARASFDGLWKTSYGPMRLGVNEKRVVGTYEFAGASHIAGTLNDKGEFEFRYDQPDGEKGTGTFELSPDGKSFQGRWARESGGGGRWRGERVEPTPGRVWLVVLEENWEESLAEPEYSYGQMLRSFFTRLPDVQVRHRFVHDRADFRRWVSEVAYLPEPVVLYISSHGSARGVNLGSDVIDADTLIESLRDVHQLRLLHFGSCEVMSGDLPRKLASARAPEERFPISGFTKTADWAGSAIVDFTYLELVLGREFAPRDAAKQTLRLVKFAGEERAGPISGSGLKLFELEPDTAATTDPAHD